MSRRSSRESGSSRSGSSKRSVSDSTLTLILPMQDLMHGALPNIYQGEGIFVSRNEVITCIPIPSSAISI
jgi:hypothetical protein